MRERTTEKRHTKWLLAVALIGGLAAAATPRIQTPTISSFSKIDKEDFLLPIRDARTPIRSLPFTINECGSYFLTDCLTGVSGQNGITVTADDVTLDLNGFTLIGVPGSMDGIATTDVRNLVVKNGNIRDWAGDGIDAWTPAGNLTWDCSFESLRVFNNGGRGIAAGNHSLVSNCQVPENAGVGIDARDGCIITGCSAYACADGIVALADPVIQYCSSRTNTGDGFRCDGAGAVVSNCASNQNGDDGYEFSNSLIVEDVARANAHMDYELTGGLEVNNYP